MAQTIPGPLRSELDSEVPYIIYLYELYYRGESEAPLRFARTFEDFVGDGNTYIAIPITHEVITQASTGEVDRVRIFAANGPLVGGKPGKSGPQYNLAALLSGEDIRTRRGRILAVSPNAPDEWAEIFSGIVSSVAWNRSNINVTATSRLDVMPILTPQRMHLRACYWRFNGPFCRYKYESTKMDPATGSPFISCPHTPDACEQRGNTPRFGGWPSIPRLYRAVV